MHERWEGVESCERLFRASPTRVATGQIAFARAKGGMDLIRIGEPQRPEFAAWRYGDQFGRRRRRRVAMAAVSVTASAGMFVLGLNVLGASVMGGFLFRQGLKYLYMGGPVGGDAVHGRSEAVVARVRDNDGAVLRVERRGARSTSLLRPEVTGGSVGLLLHHNSVKFRGSFGTSFYESGDQLLTGAAALRAAQQLMPAVNRFGASKERVSDAVSFIASVGGPAEVINSLAARYGRQSADWEEQYKLSEALPVNQRPRSLGYLPPTERLALEMALHEDSERRAMDGEMAALEQTWREAEEIARIADTL